MILSFSLYIANQNPYWINILKLNYKEKRNEKLLRSLKLLCMYGFDQSLHKI